MDDVNNPLHKIADHITDNSGDGTVVVGPICWQPSDGTSAKIYSFIVATSDRQKGVRFNRITTAGNPGRVRADFIMALARRHVIIHDVDDELYMARLCEALWAGERISKIRQGLEARSTV